MAGVSGSTPSFPMAESLTGSPMAVRPAIYIRRYANGQVRMSGHRDAGTAIKCIQAHWAGGAKDALLNSRQMDKVKKWMQ